MKKDWFDYFFGAIMLILLGITIYEFSKLDYAAAAKGFKMVIEGKAGLWAVRYWNLKEKQKLPIME